MRRVVSLAIKRSKSEQEAFEKKVEAHMKNERKNTKAEMLADVILGGQDGLVNTLGIVLGVASATNNSSIVLITGLVAIFAESISMAAVAYTSARAEQDHYRSELEREKWEIEHLPEIEEEEIRLIYMKKGFRGKELEGLVKSVIGNRELWLSVMMTEELGMTPVEKYNPVMDAFVVGVSAIIGSLVPLVPFAMLSVGGAIIFSLVVSTFILFGVGAYKASITVGDWKKSGLEMAGVGMLAAVSGYVIGKLLGDIFGLSTVSVA